MDTIKHDEAFGRVVEGLVKMQQRMAAIEARAFVARFESPRALRDATDELAFAQQDMDVTVGSIALAHGGGFANKAVAEARKRAFA